MLDEQHTLDTLLTWARTRRFGKYAGTVVSADDPTNRGRLQVIIPDIFGPSTPVWAMPCVPYAGEQIAFKMLPPPDTNVWLEFEKGDISTPIWTGFFWGESEMPDTAGTGDNIKVLQTKNITIRIDDEAGEIYIESNNGAKLTVVDTVTSEVSGSNIVVSTSSIDLDSGGTIQIIDRLVNINSGSMVVE